MIRKYWLNLGPSLLVALGIIVATLAATLATGFGWWVMTGPALLALFVVCADMLEARLRNGHLIPSLDALIMAGALPAAGFIVASSDPGLVAFITMLGGGACIPVVSRFGSGRRVCRYLSLKYQEE